MKNFEQIETEKFLTEFKKDIVEIWELILVNPSNIDLSNHISKFAELAFSNRQKTLAVLNDEKLTDSAAEALVNATTNYIYQKNQFISLSVHDELKLRQSYDVFFQQVRTLFRENAKYWALRKDLAPLIKNQSNEINTILNAILNNAVFLKTDKNAIFEKTICHEYSPELQLEVLGVTVEDLTEPILDIGCGKKGQLVKFLNQLGLKAFGTDRTIEESDIFFKADWLDLQFPENSWGTIISHMAFSNHFIFHHLNKIGNFKQYAQQYTHLLESIKPGGSFCYSPGIKFIEQFLPIDEYLLKKFSIKVESAQFKNLFQLLEEDGFYSSQVIKI